MQPFSLALAFGLSIGLLIGVGRADTTPASPIVLRRLFQADEVQLRKPVWFGGLPGKPGVFVALEQHEGAVAVLRRAEDGRWTKGEFLSLRVRDERECGLLGMAFHPDFPRNRKYYLNYNPASGGPATVVEEREADATFLRDSGRKGRVLLRIAQPQIIHNGGTLAFGPRDGYLYVGTGDGGHVHPAQDLGSLLGKMLRIDVNASPGYRIPEDNPFVGREGARPEIWAYGLRNPWKWSFDPVTGDLWAGDVGETAREEISLVARGANLGWPLREGAACRDGHPDCPDAASAGLLEPVLDLTRDRSVTLIGGVVFRGNPSSRYYGRYFFGDYRLKSIWAFRRQQEDVVEFAKVADAPSTISSFGTDDLGNIYVVGHDDGAVYRMEGESLARTREPGPSAPRGLPDGSITVSRGRPWRFPGQERFASLEIFSSAGRGLARVAVGEGPLPALRLPPGIYFARARGPAAEDLRTLVIH